MKVLSDGVRKESLPGDEGWRPEAKIKLSSVWVIEDPDNPDNNPRNNVKRKEEVCADFETAIKMTGSGKFNCLLMFICGSVFANSAVSITMISFVLPSAQCDLRLSSEDKGRMTAAPIVGTVLGSIIWGMLADAKGRRRMIITGLLLDAAFTIVSSVVHNFWLFLFTRLICGFSIAAANTLLFAYVGEFLESTKRDRMLCWLELSWSIAFTILPIMASVLIPQTWTVDVGGFVVFNSWRAFVALCGVPSLLNAVLVWYLPEAPKYLMAKDRMLEALQAFQKIHRINKGTGREYAVTSLQAGPEAEGRGVSAVTKGEEAAGGGGEGRRKWGMDCTLLAPLTFHLKALFSRPLLVTSVLTLSVQAILMSSYYTFVMWFPDLFDRFEHFQLLYPNRTASICEVTAVIAGVGGVDALPCGADGQATVPAAVFHHATYMGIACILAGLLLIAFIDLLGKRTILVMSMVVSGACTLGLNFVWTSMQNLILSCIFEGISGLAISLILCVVVELIPTNHRAFALSLQHTTGRVGAVIGNIIFGWLIDFNCDIPLITGGVLLIGGGLLSLMIPRANQEQQKQ